MTDPPNPAPSTSTPSVSGAEAESGPANDMQTASGSEVERSATNPDAKQSTAPESPDIGAQPATPPATLSGVLTGSQIREEGLIVELDPSCLKGASYDLRLGYQVVMCGTGVKRIIDLRRQSVEVVTIPPFGTIIFETLEEIDTRGKRNIVGQIGLRVTLALEGLILQLGPQIDPGYRGKLFGLLLNTSTEPKELRFRDKILTVQFCYTSRPLSDTEYQVLEGKGIKDFIAKKNIRWERIAKENVIQSLQKSVELSLQTVEKIREEVYTVATLNQAVRQNRIAMIAFIAGVIATLITVWLWGLDRGK